MLQEELMKEVSVGHALNDGIDVASVAQVPTSDSPEIIKGVPALFLLNSEVTRPEFILELLLNKEFHAFLDTLVRLNYGREGLFCQECISHEQLRFSLDLKDFSDFLVDFH
jgi:hypothetical protein